MDGQFSDTSLLPCEPDEPEIAPGLITTGELKASSSSSPPSPKRSRRSIQKRVVSIPIENTDGSRTKGVGEGAPPSDSWAWRKYGQKPIKGSPYPRGYYRCSSLKGCPARKQVERSHVDPNTLVVTYTSEHNHPWPIAKNHNHQTSSPAFNSKPPMPAQDDLALIHPSPPEPTDRDDNFADLIVEESALMMPDDFRWFSDVGSPSSTSSQTEVLLYGPIFGAAAELLPEECDKLGGGWVEKEEEEDSLFAGLGELPECSVVFRRGFLERQMRGEESRRCGLSAASWCGSTG